MNYIHPGANVQQCDEANREFGQTGCCNSSIPSACVNGGWPEYTKYNFKATRTSNKALTWDQIKSEIYCAKRPFAFTWHWNNGGGHVMVATGYRTIDGRHYVSVNNPWPPTGGVHEVYTYDKYVGGSSYDHTHWDDFYQIVYGGP